MADKERSAGNFDTQLAYIKERIESLKAAATAKGPEVLDHYAGDLERLLEKYETARYKLTLLRKGSGDALSELRGGFENALTDVKTAVTKAWNKF